jgi:hypothetical protein
LGNSEAVAGFVICVFEKRYFYFFETGQRDTFFFTFLVVKAEETYFTAVDQKFQKVRSKPSS